MNDWETLRVGLTAAGVAALVGAWAWIYFRRRRQNRPEEIERLRRLQINRRGRITAGRIVELPQVEPSEFATPLVVYQYEVSGVTYQAAQDVSALPAVASVTRGAAGQTVSIKYDPQKPTNSIIACEDWCGVPAIETDAERETEPAQTSGGPPG